MKRILITGASGLLGGSICQAALSRYEVFGMFHTHEVAIEGVTFIQGDLSEKKGIAQIEKVNPDFIVHSAALTNVDMCEQYPDEAQRHNVTAAVRVADIAKKCGAYLAHISTDHVFDGRRGNYIESDSVNPVNIYGESKLKAEQKVCNAYPEAAIVRTNIFGWNRTNKFSLAEWMLDKLNRKEELPGFEDVIFSPIFVNDLAEILFKVEEARLKGIIHIAGSNCCSKLDFAYHIADIFGYDKSGIKPVSIDDVALKAQRGKNTSLKVDRIEKLLGMKMPSIDDGLKAMYLKKERGSLAALKDG